ncbi:MAG: hypothetical protein IMZ61_02240 [Planctomycetes bacterium]|nr:hypothetical protein [Planctomycetota bacterium]
MANPTVADKESVKETTLKLLAYCRAHDWAGFDPYDALNSRVFRAFPFLNFKLVRLVLTQAVKRCPINLRPLLLVPRTPNPKGIALFLSSITRLQKIGLIEKDNLLSLTADKLLSLRSVHQRRSCWGYNFDWQTRTYLVPKGSPNIICSTFAANGLLDAFEYLHDPVYLDAAMGTADFILETLFWREGPSKACFSYTPLERTEIHNANLLGAAFLCRVGRMTGQQRYIEPALEAARFSVTRQHKDGAWAYGETAHQGWIDNFHTGYNLTALRRIRDYSGTAEFDDAILRGFDFYRTHFFREDGAAKYYHNATYPIDIHSIAQSILTLVEFEDFGGDNRNLAYSVLNWAIANMWDARGYFCFQKLPHYKVRTPFMRWSEAWMLLALTTLIEEWPQPEKPTCGNSGESKRLKANIPK